MNYLILDTNIWIYLANGTNLNQGNYDENGHQTLLSRLIEKHTNNEINILANEIIIEEWNRNKEAKLEFIKKYENKIKNNYKHFLLIGKDLNKADNKRLKRLHKHYKKHLIRKISINKEQIESLEKIIKNETQRIEITKDVKAKTSDWAIEKKAPFHKNKNSHADALILFSAIDYLSKNMDPMYDTAIFVSNNKEEFCVSKESSKIHSDLIDEFDLVDLKLETHIGRALDLSEVLTEEIQIELRKIEENLERCHSPFCNHKDLWIGSVHYFDKLLIENDKNKFDENQLNIDFDLEYLPQKPREFFTAYGQCSICSSEYIKCPNCNSQIIIDDYENIVCGYCESEFLFDVYNQVIKIIKLESIDDIKN